MKRIRLIITMFFLFISGLSLSAQDEIKLARSASDPGVNGVAYNFTGKLQSSTGQTLTAGGMLALMSTGNGTMEGVLVDSINDITYSVKATHSLHSLYGCVQKEEKVILHVFLAVSMGYFLFRK